MPVSSEERKSAAPARPTLLTVIPVYNGEQFIRRTLESVAEQTLKPERVIVLDNCSTDRTREAVACFSGIPCEWRQNETNLGLFGNLNRALEFASQAQYLHVLHADDLIKPDFYDLAIRASADVPGRALIYCASELIDELERPITRLRAQTPGRRLRRVSLREFLIGRSELRPFYFPGVLLKTVASATPVEFRSDLPQLGDQVFWAEWARHCEGIVELPGCLSLYRIHSQSGTTGNIRSLEAWVLDEWRAMSEIALMLEENRLARWVRLQRLKCIFAARSQVKMNMIKDGGQDFAVRIASETRTITGLAPWTAARIAVALLR